MKKGILGIFLALCMLCTLFPLSAFAADNRCGDDLTWNFNAGVLTISGTGNMWSYIQPHMDAPWSGFNHKIESVVIGNGVTSIGSGAFDYCGLKTVTIPESVTEIGLYAFDLCTSLESVTIPDSIIKIGQGAFSNCTSLKTATIGSGLSDVMDTSNRASKWIAEVFSDCSELTAVNVSEDNQYYSSLDGVVFNKDKTELLFYPEGKVGDYTVPDGVLIIEPKAFYSCAHIENVTVSDDVYNISPFSFTQCDALKSVSLGKAVSYVTAKVFVSCGSLQTINVSSDNPYFCSDNGIVYSKNKSALVCYPTGRVGAFEIPDSVGSIGEEAFYNCAGLSAVTIPGSVTEIGRSAFSDCAGLTSVTIPASVTRIDEFVFSVCSNLSSVKFEGKMPNFYSGYRYEHLFAACADDFKMLVPQYDATWTSSDAYDADAQTWNGYPVEFYHDHSYTAKIIKPTCTEAGYTTYTCECGDSYVDDYVDATGDHNYKNGKCTVCGAADPDYNPYPIVQIFNSFANAINNVINSITNFFKSIFRF